MTRLLLLPFSLVRTASRVLVVLLLLASLALNAALVSVPSVFASASELLERAEVPTVRRTHGRALKAARARNVRLAEQVAEQNRRIATQARKIAAQSSAKRRLVTRIDRQQRELDRRAGQIRAESAARRKLERRLVDASARVSSRSGSIARRIKRASIRNVAAMAGEAAPFVGIGVIVGTTVWELKDACDTLGDLRALNATLNPADPIDLEEVCRINPPSVPELCQELGLPMAWCLGTATAEGVRR